MTNTNPVATNCRQNSAAVGARAAWRPAADGCSSILTTPPVGAEIRA